MTTKELILGQLAEKFKQANLLQLMLIYDNASDSLELKAQDINKKTLKIPIEKMESVTIRTMLIRKVKKALDKDFQKFIVKIDMTQQDLNMIVTYEGLEPELFEF